MMNERNSYTKQQRNNKNYNSKFQGWFDAKSLTERHLWRWDITLTILLAKALNATSFVACTTLVSPSFQNLAVRILVHLRMSLHCVWNIFEIVGSLGIWEQNENNFTYEWNLINLVVTLKKGHTYRKQSVRPCSSPSLNSIIHIVASRWRGRHYYITHNSRTLIQYNQFYWLWCNKLQQSPVRY